MNHERIDLEKVKVLAVGIGFGWSFGYLKGQLDEKRSNARMRRDKKIRELEEEVMEDNE